MGHRMKFLKLMKNVQSEESTTTVRPLNDSTYEVEEVELAVQVRAANSTADKVFFCFSMLIQSVVMVESYMQFQALLEKK